ncbi:MAG: hypothetical protein H6836_05290 [Planctomycetes bacterium]|nr:hypothetical protein [Planctomycetota bacterium]
MNLTHATLVSCAAVALLTALAEPAAAQRRSKPVVRLSAADFPPLPASHTRPAPPRPGRDGARPVILLTGYWPPTNEMVRRFSQSTTQNPAGWIGSNWENRGYDIVSYFPEFPQGIGKGVGDFEVDYQDTMADWWRIVPAMKPIAIITNSRGGANKNWEIEMNGYNNASWYADYLAPFYPNPSPPDLSIPADSTRRSSLPAREMLAALAAARIDVNAWACFDAGGGGFLSEFIGYHGMYYKQLHGDPSDPAWCIAAGHIHVGPHTVSVLEQALFVCLRELTAHVDRVLAGTAQHNRGFGTTGTAILSMAGTGLGSGQSSDLLLDGAGANAPLLLLLSSQYNVTPVRTGLLIAAPIEAITPAVADASGRLLWKVVGGGGPARFFAQFAYPNPRLSGGAGLSNAVEVRFRQ